MVITDDQLNELIRLSEAATQGEWVADGNGVHRGVSNIAVTSGGTFEQSCANAKYVAAVSPQVVKQLIGRIRELETQNKSDYYKVESLESQLAASRTHAINMEEAVENVRESLGLESTHYLVIAGQVADVVNERSQLQSRIRELEAEREKWEQPSTKCISE